ncbi:hypothetical protein J0A94_16865 [Paraclostridium bifermentans]|uniref:hypothetical protein n=1 Tax=Paraclostridium bifermentans TaxID=1490 RepID=UPI0019D42A70|nr:hypothetical protein [Paraclostridium bifermentans]MBN8049499.1 hypothetical protein [Paraclostridium bifermentans]
MSFGNALALEFLKALMVCVFGIISFRTFERFKNKKEATKLYIALKKLEKDVEDNKGIIQEAINEYIELEILEDNFNMDKQWDKELNKLYKNISELSIFIDFYDEIDENGDIIGRIEEYAEKPYELIHELNSAIYYYEDPVEIENIEKEIENYNNLNIYTELDKIYNEINKLIENGFIINNQLTFLKEKLEKYNKLDKVKKKKYLDKFCKTILEKRNEFTESLKMYREIQNKNTRLNSDEKIKLKFDEWNTIENIEILALYDVESYIKIEEMYEKLFEPVNINNISSLKNRYKLIEKLLEYIVKHKKKLKKILRKNNRYFKDV